MYNWSSTENIFLERAQKSPTIFFNANKFFSISARRYFEPNEQEVITHDDESHSK